MKAKTTIMLIITAIAATVLTIVGIIGRLLRGGSAPSTGGKSAPVAGGESAPNPALIDAEKKASDAALSAEQTSTTENVASKTPGEVVDEFHKDFS